MSNDEDTYEVSVSAFAYYTVTADSKDEAREKAKDDAQADLPYGFQVNDAHADEALL